MMTYKSTALYEAHAYELVKFILSTIAGRHFKKEFSDLHLNIYTRSESIPESKAPSTKSK